MVEEIADKFQQAIIKGFINIIMLSILEKGPSHGYKIKKEIENRTLGMWIPADSTLYTDLKKMTNDGLIKFITKTEGERARKIYELTDKGRNTLSRIAKKEKRMKNAISSLMTLILPEDETKELIEHDFKKQKPFFPTDMIFNNLDKGMSVEEKIQYLLQQKSQLTQHMKTIQNVVNNIDLKLSKLKKENE